MCVASPWRWRGDGVVVNETPLPGAPPLSLVAAGVDSSGVGGQQCRELGEALSELRQQLQLVEDEAELLRRNLADVEEENTKVKLILSRAAVRSSKRDNSSPRPPCPAGC